MLYRKPSHSIVIKIWKYPEISFHNKLNEYQNSQSLVCTNIEMIQYKPWNDGCGRTFYRTLQLDRSSCIHFYLRHDIRAPERWGFCKNTHCELSRSPEKELCHLVDKKSRVKKLIFEEILKKIKVPSSLIVKSRFSSPAALIAWQVNLNCTAWLRKVFIILFTY